MQDKSIASGSKRTMWAGVLIGIGIMAAIDEIIFHQVLQWHHFFDQATPTIGLLSDGLLHALELILLVIGIFMIADAGRDGVLAPLWGWAGFFIGAGGFQLFDGIVDHKILRIHQIRYDVDDLFFYDMTWILSGLVILLIGIIFMYQARSEGNPPAPSEPQPQQ